MRTRQLKPGMKLDHPVVDRLGRNLVARGAELDDYMIDSLLKLGIMSVYIQEGEEEENPEQVPTSPEAEKNIEARITKLMSIKGKESVDSLHKRLGHIMWEHIGMARDEKGLKEAIEMLKDLKKEFWSNVFIPGSGDDQNIELEKALRLADFIEIGTLMAHDALDRAESCGGHFRVEHQTEEGEALRHSLMFLVGNIREKIKTL